MSKRPPADTSPATKVVTGGRRREWTGAVVNPPVWRASTHLYENIAALRDGPKTNEDGRFFYGRRGAPTQWSLAEALTDLEPGAAGTILFPSGVAAIAGALLAVLKPGDVLLMTDSAYDPSRGFADNFLKGWGVETRYYDPLIGAGIADLICDRTRAVWMESPGSLTFEVQDVPAICAAAKARDARIVTLLDNTWATPLAFPALRHGVDIAMLACTKYVVGHSDVMLGSLTANERNYPKIRRVSQQLGQVASPDDAWLAARGLRTMAVRLKQHGEAGLKIARWLAGRPEVARVLHPALPSCPGHAIFARDFAFPTGLFSFVLKGGDEAGRARLIDALSLFGIGYSWGGFESLAIPIDPATCRSATTWPLPDMAAEDRFGIRLHIGLEDPDDLIADLASGFEAYNVTPMTGDLLVRLDALLGDTPSDRLYLDLGLSVATVVIAYLIGWFIARHAAPPISSFLISHSQDSDGEKTRRRVQRIVRHAPVTLILGIALGVWPWSDLARLILALTLGWTTGRLVIDVLRLVHLPGWLVTMAGLLVGFSVTAGAMGGIEPVMASLDRIGLSIGTRRISLAGVVVALATIVALVAVYRLASRIINGSIQRSSRLDAAQKLLGEKIAAVILIALAFFLGIDILGIDLTALAFFSGAFGLAIGFGMQKTIGNLIAGIILLMDRSIKPGDVIVVKDSFGWVNKIGVRAVSVLTRDGKEHLIPNEILMTTEVENWSFSDSNIRIKVPVPVDYGSDMRLVEKLLYQAAQDVPRVLANPQTMVWMMELGESAVRFEIRAWINDPQGGVGNVSSMILWRVWELFEANGVRVPFPQRDLHVRSWAVEAERGSAVPLPEPEPPRPGPEPER